MAIRNMTIADIKQVIQLHTDSFGESLNLLAGDDYLAAVFRWFIESDNIAIVSTIDSHIAGYIIGAPIGYEKQLNRKVWPVAFLGLLRHPLHFLNKKLLLNILSRVEAIFGVKTTSDQPLVKELGKGVSLVGIAVAPEFKGKGVAEELEKAFGAAAEKYNPDFLRLSVLKTNKRAQKFYSRMGWSSYEVKDAYYFFKKIR